MPSLHHSSVNRVLTWSKWVLTWSDNRNLFLQLPKHLKSNLRAVWAYNLVASKFTHLQQEIDNPVVNRKVWPNKGKRLFFVIMGPFGIIFWTLFFSILMVMRFTVWCLNQDYWKLFIFFWCLVKKENNTENTTMVKLNHISWLIWKTKMEDILYCKDLYDPTEGYEARRKDISNANQKKMHRKTIGHIRQWGITTCSIICLTKSMCVPHGSK